MSVVVVAELELIAGREEEGEAALRKLVEETHAKDPGCELYALHRDQAEPTHLVMIEKWKSAAALEAHLATEHIAELGGREVLAGPPRIVMLDPLGFGDGGKGSL